MPNLESIIITALEDLKAINIISFDVRPLTIITDTMIICSGRSTRHVQALANTVYETVKKHDYRPLGVEGQKASEWILIDLNEAIVHIMLPQTREFYSLEKLWNVEQKTQ